MSISALLHLCVLISSASINCNHQKHAFCNIISPFSTVTFPLPLHSLLLVLSKEQKRPLLSVSAGHFTINKIEGPGTRLRTGDESLLQGHNFNYCSLSIRRFLAIRRSASHLHSSPPPQSLSCSLTSHRRPPQCMQWYPSQEPKLYAAIHR